MANLIIDIGNTALKAAWSEGQTLGKTFRYQGERAVDFILSLTSRVKPEVIVIATVRDLSASDIRAIEKECTRLVRIDSAHTELLTQHNIPSYLSPDRAASIVAVRHLFSGKACTVFDLGTTLTIDFILPDGTYGGGNISPGCRTRFKAINRYSKALPLIDTPDLIEDAGTSISTSIGAGVVKGIMFEIEGYLHQHPDNIVVFTGGDAIYFAKKMKNAIFVVCNLVLMGLALIAEEYD